MGFFEKLKEWFSSSADKRIAAIEAKFEEQLKINSILTKSMTDLNIKYENSQIENQEFKTKWEESDKRCEKSDKRNEESDKEIKRLNTTLQKAQKLLSEYIAHCNKENSYYSNDKEEYIKKCNDVTIILSSIAGNLLAQRSSLDSQINETRIKLKNNPKQSLKISLEINLEKLTKDYERIANEEERINTELRNTKIDKDQFIKTINERIASCTKERDDLEKEMATIFDDQELKEKTVSEILAEYDRKNASLEVN